MTEEHVEVDRPKAPEGRNLLGAVDHYFGLGASGTTVPTELRAGLATFLTMSYIMFVNPAILDKAGMEHGAVFVATCLAAALSTAVMGLYANYPIALAPGRGLNAYFAFTMVPELGGNWQLALGVVFLSDALFLVISLTPLREWLINAIPINLKLGIAAGMGLFLALIGLQNPDLVAADATTLEKLGDLTEAKALLAIAGFLGLLRARDLHKFGHRPSSVVDAETAVPRRRRERSELRMGHMNQRLMIATLQVHLRLVVDTVVDHRIKPVALTGWGNSAGQAVIEQFFDFVLVRQLNVQAKLRPEII